MEGGIGGNFLDPAAMEFYPANQFGPVPAQIYYPYPPPPPPHPLPPAAAYNPHLQHYALPEDGEATRAVVLSLLPGHIEEAAVATAMESFGAVRAIESAALVAEGAATVHFYDLRSALAAVFEIREQHMSQQRFLSRQYGVVPSNWGLVEWSPVAEPVGRGLVAGHAVWAQFGARGVDGPNQGSLFVFNCDPAVPLSYLAELFGAIGHVKEVREIPWKPPQRFVEFFDIRDAARALSELNGTEVYGRQLVLEFTSSTAGHSKRRSSGHHRGFAQPPRLQRPQPGRWVEVPLPSSSSSRGANRKPEVAVTMKTCDVGRKVAKNQNAGISGSAVEDKRGKASHQPSAGGASSSSSSSSSTVAAKQQQLRRRGWKNHPRNGGDARFQFKEEIATEGSSSSSNDSRTTVMIKNIPNKYSQKQLLMMLDNHCRRCNEEIGDRADDDQGPLSAYDFVYLPIDFNNKCNVGYGFVNLTTPEAAVRLYKAFHMQPWEVFNSRKICQVNYARLQGLEALKEHFKNSKFACDTDEYMPVIFCPPRDGKRLTEPVTVGGRGGGSGFARRNRDGGLEGAEAGAEDAWGASSTTASTHAPSDNADGADDDDDDGRGGCSSDDETASRLSQALLQLSTYSSQG